VRVVKLNRGKKKVTCIYGLDGFDFNIKDLSKHLGKKFACGNGILKDDFTEENLIQLLGDCDEEELKEAMALKVPELKTG
jgi:translation initiation factor 1 (eIF-1/SUI1)